MIVIIITDEYFMPFIIIIVDYETLLRTYERRYY